MTDNLPEHGQIVIVRRRPFVVNEIETSRLKDYFGLPYLEREHSLLGADGFM
jgi:hypothetical protein